MANKIQTLTSAAVGNTWRISAFDGGECKQLREMGFCEKLKVTKLSNGRNIICVTCGTKLVLNRKLADQVLVCPV
jgi:Fe2+ transport system protein FeoA